MRTWKKLTLISVVIIVVICVLWICLTFIECVDMNFAKRGKAVFKYNNVNVDTNLSEKDLASLCDMFDGELLYKDSPSCGFAEDIAVHINDSQTFCFACDTCPVIYWKEKDKYFKISEEEKIEMYGILEKYGFCFPCV